MLKSYSHGSRDYPPPHNLDYQNKHNTKYNNKAVAS